MTGHAENVLPRQTQDFLFAQFGQPGQGKDWLQGRRGGFQQGAQFAGGVALDYFHVGIFMLRLAGLGQSV